MDVYERVTALGECGPDTDIDLMSDLASLLAYYDGIGAMVLKHMVVFDLNILK